MRAVLLAAGYGTRMERSLESDSSGKYAHLLGIPKPLLPVGGIPLLSHWTKVLKSYKGVRPIVIVINEAHRSHYEEWLKDWGDSDVLLVSDGSTSNEGRSGAVSCMALGLQDSFEDDVIFIGGDTLFMADFSFKETLRLFSELKLKNDSFCLVSSAPVREDELSMRGIIEVSQNGRVEKFLEKPQPCHTVSRLQSPCFYVMSSASLKYIEIFLQDMQSAPLLDKDAPGTFIRWVLERIPVFAIPVSGRFDVGTLESYIDCNDKFVPFH